MNGISDPVVSWRAIWLARQAFRSLRLVENSFRPIANFENYWRTRSKYASSFLRTCSEFGNRALWLAVTLNSQSKCVSIDWFFLQPIITRILRISLYFITSLIRSIKWCTARRAANLPPRENSRNPQYTCTGFGYSTLGIWYIFGSQPWGVPNHHLSGL